MSAPEGARPAARQRTCPRCSADVEPLQEYCLECGLRLPHQRATPLEHTSAISPEHGPWSGGWIVPALLGLLIAVLGTGAAIAISDNGESPAAVTTATGGSSTAPETTSTLTAPEPTAPAPTTAPRTTAPTTTTPPRPPATLAWPRDRRGWTIVLVSLPQSVGRDGADERAAEARRGGLPNVGVLNSSRFASLHPGYFVVFTGIFDSQAEATSALPRARSAFPLAYQREIVP